MYTQRDLCVQRDSISSRGSGGAKPTPPLPRRTRLFPRLLPRASSPPQTTHDTHHNAHRAPPLPQATGLKEFPLSIAITVVALIAFGPVCALFGGALFNPVHNVAFIAAGKDSVRLNVLRMAAQVAGAVLGAFLAVSMLPEWLKE